MSRIFKRGKVWWVDFEYQERRIRHSLKTRSKRIAELKLDEIELQAAREELKLKKRKQVSFESFSQRFLAWYEAQNSKRAYRDYKNLFCSTLIPFFKKYNLSDVRVETIERYKIFRAEKVKPASVNKELTALKHLFNKAIQWDECEKNPLVFVKRLRVSERSFRFLSIEEVERVLKTSPDNLYPIILTAVHTGMRKSELFRLEWDDVDFERGVITVRAKGDEHTKNYRNRVIPMTQKLESCLSDLKRRSRWVFTRKDGSRYATWPRKGLETIVRKSGITRFTLHDLRHTFASQLVMEGIDLPTVQKLMGHAAITTTMIYSHLAPEHLKNAVNRLGSRLENGTNLAQWRKTEKLGVVQVANLQ